MGALGWVLQWAKGPKKIPTWVSYVVFGAIAAAVFVWRTPEVESADWRLAVGMFGSFLAGVEGFTAIFRKAGLAPKTDSL
jgi:hypothetical protein